MKLVYIAGKFRGPTAWDIEQNIRRAEIVGMEVARLGAAPLIPHANTRFFHGTLTDEFWLAATMEMLNRCDAVQLVQGWPSSKGTIAEIEHAKARGIPVFVVDGGLESWLKEASKADRGGDSGQDSAKPEIRVRECAEAAQAGDATAARSASPSHALGEPGAGTSIASATGTGSAGANPVSTIPVPGELCDIDDLPDCLIGGVHQPHCRHAGKTVTIGGNL